jgi:tetratricopeptide (TPR) repeat protein
MVSSASQAWADAERLLATGSTMEAEAIYSRLRAHPQFGPSAALRLSLIASRNGDFRKAIDEAAHAARAGTSDPDLLELVAKRLLAIGEKKPALDVVRRLLALPAIRATTLAELGKMLSDADEPAHALQLLRRAERGGLSSAALHYLIGLSEMYVGNEDQALHQLETSLDLDPMFARAHWALVKLGGRESDERHIDQLKSAIGRLDDAHPDIPLLLYSLFHRLDRLGDAEVAWSALARAMRARRMQVRYDATSESRMFDILPSARAVADPGGTEGPVPVFIIGLPRTGTTLLDILLGRHAEVARAGELRDFNWALRWAANQGGVPLLDERLVAALAGRALEGLGGRYLERTQWRAGLHKFYTDKLPPNFMNVGWIADSLPQARIVHLVRNPMDACFSNLKELFAAPYAYSYDQGEMAGHYARYRTLMARWHDRFPDRILDVSYEELVRDPDATVRKVMAHCGIEGHLGTDDSMGSEKVVATASAMQVREPVHQRGIGAWTRYARHLAPLQRELEAAGLLA